MVGILCTPNSAHVAFDSYSWWAGAGEHTLTSSLAAAVAALAVVVVGAVVFDIPFCRRSSLTIAGTFIVSFFIVEV